MDILTILPALAAGIILGGLFIYLKYKNSISLSEHEKLKENFNSVIIEKEKISDRLNNLDANFKSINAELSAEREKVLQLNKYLASAKTTNDNLNIRLQEQKEELENLQKRFTVEFENLANKILEEKSTKFTLQNRENLDQLLKPLGEKIKDFEKKVDEVYVKDSSERAALVQQIRTLHELNQQMSKDANNLTKALKGDSQYQGSWGEFILESVLEKSGLVKGREYQIQETLKSENGRNLRPDVIIYLPDDKCIIIDSKVSLTAYEQCVSCNDENERGVFLKEHVRSLKQHIKSLGEKNYQSIYSVNSPDFVLMFVAIEPAFALAVQAENNLFYEAFEKNIVLVSPSTLLATLRTISNIWKQENQNRNVLEIAKQSGEMYDKFVGFVDDLIAMGRALQATRDKYEGAMNKLTAGRGNLVGKAEKIKALGAKTTKTLPDSLIKRIEEDSDGKLPL